MSFDDWTHEGKSTPAPSPPSTPNLLLLNKRHSRVLDGDRRALWPNPWGAGCLVLFLLPFFAAGLYLPFSSLRSYWIERHIYADPVRVTAQVTGTRTSSGEDDDTYYVKYRYLRFEREADVSEAEQNRAKVSGKIDVYYSRTEPKWSRAVREPPVSLGFVLLWTAIWDGTLLLMTLGALNTGWRTRRLVARGRLVGGIVTAARSHLDSDNDLVLTLEYRFQDPAGQTVDATHTETRNDYKDRPLPAAGTPLAVLYADPSTYRVL